MQELLDAVVICLRICCLMRSVHIARMVFGLWTDGERYFIKYIPKGGGIRTLQVSGSTLGVLLQYMHRIRRFPQQWMMRYTRQPRLCLSAERLASRTKEKLAALGLDTRIYRSHSIRGAAATAFLALGIPLPTVQKRGGWSAPHVLQKHYDATHQSAMWDRRTLGLEII